MAGLGAGLFNPGTMGVSGAGLMAGGVAGAAGVEGIREYLRTKMLQAKGQKSQDIAGALERANPDLLTGTTGEITSFINNELGHMSDSEKGVMRNMLEMQLKDRDIRNRQGLF